MYRVMLVDDEIRLRNLMKKIIDWSGFQMEIAGEAESGIEAINTIDEIRPDIIFVDIRMPFMNGIEFSKLAMKRYPQMKIIILTAHDDFSYAKECIGIGVSDYLLKPIIRGDIIETLKKVKENLESREKMEETISEDGSRSTLGPEKLHHYIEKNYQDANLNLTSAANDFGFNASYFSRKFTELMGKSFIEYLTTYRIDQSCIMAEQGLLMYITSKEVGIPDPNYFGKCFKKQKQISYTEYMRKKRKEGEADGT